ncbi:unnamed protein product [Owenia fusiformis]|uniref:Uncharacterized protein n=1 Tax=Owenia fusiformis TaxID=6347 RepID=A0A8J1XIY1_OWEFU|nr:unnamed protein product [Owenia fusiformis]
MKGVALIIAAILATTDGVLGQIACGVDVVFAVDTSCIFTKKEKSVVKDFLFELVTSLDEINPIGRDKALIQIAALTYNTIAVSRFNLSDSTDKASTLGLIELLNMNRNTAEGCKRKTNLALELAKKAFQKTNGGRRKAKRVLILITNGLTQPSKLMKNALANGIKNTDANIETYLIGIYDEKVDPNEADAEWAVLASDPDDHHVMSVNGTDMLKELVDNIAKRVMSVTCNDEIPADDPWLGTTSTASTTTSTTTSTTSTTTSTTSSTTSTTSTTPEPTTILTTPVTTTTVAANTQICQETKECKKLLGPNYNCTNFICVRGDPHIQQLVKGTDDPICYDLFGEPGQIYEFLTEKSTGTSVTGVFIEGSDTIKSGDLAKYIGEIVIDTNTVTIHATMVDILLHAKRGTGKRSNDIKLFFEPLEIEQDARFIHNWERDTINFSNEEQTGVKVNIYKTSMSVHIDNVATIYISRHPKHLDFVIGELNKLADMKNKPGGIMGIVSSDGEFVPSAVAYKGTVHVGGEFSVTVQWDHDKKCWSVPRSARGFDQLLKQFARSCLINSSI